MALQRSTGISSNERPDKAEPDPTDALNTGELGSEGGSWGDRTQHERTTDDSDGVSLAASHPAEGRAFGGLVWVAVGLVLVLVIAWFASS